jgi:hypothetical protein
MGRRILAISLWSLSGLIVGFFVRSSLPLGERQTSKGADLLPRFSIPATNYATKSRSFLAAIEAYRFKRPRTVDDRVGMLKTLDLWLSDNPVDCVNSLRDIGALGLLDQDAIIFTFTEISEGGFGLQMRMATEIRSPDLRDAVMSAVFNSAVASDPKVALDLLAVVPVHLKPGMENRLGLAFGEIADPSLFAELVRHSSVRKELIISGMQVWAKKRTSDALSFLDSIDEVRLQQIGTSKGYILEKLESSLDPEAVLRYAEKQPAGAARIRIMTSAIGTLLSEDPNRWDELTSRQYSDITIAAIAADAAAKIVVKSPDTAALYLSRIPGMDARVEATKQTARQFYFSSGGGPEKVIAWARSIQDPIVADRIIAELRFQGVKLPKDFKLR